MIETLYHREDRRMTMNEMARTVRELEPLIAERQRQLALGKRLAVYLAKPTMGLLLGLKMVFKNSSNDHFSGT
jgi:hypothetical protein